jgi:hypothetical protein
MARLAEAVASRQRVLLSLLMVGIAAVAIVGVWDAPLRTRMFPLAVAFPMLALGLYQTARDLRSSGPDGTARAGPPGEPMPTDGLPISGAGANRAIAWFVGFVAAVLALGFPLAIPLYTFLFLWFVSRERLIVAGGLAAAAWGAFELLFVRLLHLPLFSGFLFSLLGLD